MNETSIFRKSWITFRPEVTMGTVLTIIAWVVFGVIAWTKVGDRLQYVEDAQHNEREEQAAIIKELGAIQQLNASQTAIVSMMQERLRQDEETIYGENRKDRR